MVWQPGQPKGPERPFLPALLPDHMRNSLTLTGRGGALMAARRGGRESAARVGPAGDAELPAGALERREGDALPASVKPSQELRAAYQGLCRLLLAVDEERAEAVEGEAELVSIVEGSERLTGPGDDVDSTLHGHGAG
eukprot:760757-Hanusia_phi.AAC.1